VQSYEALIENSETTVSFSELVGVPVQIQSVSLAIGYCRSLICLNRSVSRTNSL